MKFSIAPRITKLMYNANKGKNSLQYLLYLEGSTFFIYKAFPIAEHSILTIHVLLSNKSAHESETKFLSHNHASYIFNRINEKDSMLIGCMHIELEIEKKSIIALVVHKVQ